MKRLLLYLFFLLPYVTIGQNVRINSPGKAPTVQINAAGKTSNVRVSAPGSITQPETPPATYQNILIETLGESNTGGQALNTELTSGELAIRSSVQILNNTNLLFESLDIGTNNALGHTGLATNIYHSWENGLAHQVEDGLMHNPTYLTKNGQGGSLISQWNEGGAYYTTFVTRTDTAIKMVTALNGGTTPRIFIWFSLGINDALNGTSAATFKTGVTDLFNRIRTRWPSNNIVFLVTQLPTAYNSLNTPLTQIASELTAVHITPTSDLTLYMDGRHWTSASQRTIADRNIATMKANYTF